MIESFQLPFHFETSGLRSELENLQNSEWMPHFNTGYYSGNWNGIALRSPGGKTESIYPMPNSEEEYKDTSLMNVFPSVEKIIRTFECPLTSIRFLRLEKGAEIKEHSDNALSFEDGDVRLHIPVITDDAIEFMSNGKRLIMKEGECWYVNAGLPHSVANKSNTDRIHLVIDCTVNDWLRSFFPETEVKEKKGLESIKTKKDLENMISLLREMGTPAALKLIEDLSADNNG